MTAATAVEAPPGRVLMVAFNTSSVRRVNRFAWNVGVHGVEVTALVADGQGWARAEPVRPDVEVLSLGRAENSKPLVFAYVALVERLPGGLLRRLEDALPGPLGRAAGLGRKAHRKIAGKLRKHVFWRIYRPLRGHALRRLALRRLDALNLSAVSKVICVDEATVPFGWALARRFPDLEVTRAINTAVYTELPIVAEKIAWNPESPETAARPPYRAI
jgi:hypothetical protein